MGQSLTRKLIDAHLVSGKAVAGEEIGLRVDQVLLTDTNGAMAVLQFEAMREFPVEGFFRDVRLWTIASGTSEMMREIIARRLLS